MKKKAQLRLDMFFDNKNKRPQFFLCDFSKGSPKATWLVKKPEKLSWTEVVKWKGIGDIILCSREKPKETAMDVEKNDDLVKVINENKVEYNPKIISFLKSHLQKSVRRQNVLTAVESAFQLFKINKNEILRRLSIIVFEDVRLKEYYPELVWYIAAVSKGYKLKKEDIELVLSYVVDLCCDSKYDEIFDGSSNNQIEYAKFVENVEKSKISQEEKDIAYSIAFRISYGGMGWDVAMLSAYAEKWFERFQEKKEVPRMFVPKEYKKLCDINYLNENPLRADEYLLQGLDFHSYPQLVNEVNQELNNKYSPEDIKGCIWEFSSGVNTRKDQPKDEKLEIIWSDIRSVLQKLQGRYIGELVKEMMNTK